MDTMDDDDIYIGNEQADALAKRFEKDGVDTRYLEEPFLEVAELGDARSLQQRLSSLSPDERRQFVRAVDQQGRSGLILAVRRSDIEVVRVLLDGGANPNDVDSSGVAALHYAGSIGSPGLIDLLLKCRADVDRRDDDGETPLMWVQSRSAAECLLRGGADANLKNHAGRNAMMLASSRGNLETVKLLASQPEAPLDLLDSQGLSALRLAALSGHTDVAELLTSLGATVAASRPNDDPAKRRVASVEEALHDIVRRGDSEACISFLEETGVDVDSRIDGETPLLVAAGMGAGRMMEVLLDSKADPTAIDPYLKESPLLRAVLNHCKLEVLWMLLEAKADPLQADMSGRTPATIAASWQNADALEILTAAVEGDLDL
mmetsp:Transcript_27590/g.58718  ORF Transcript_27590/g.58718 Transcript_27590/m.58718 type:complete len:376 (+) Transcript_27590:95-1222(+)